MAAKFFTGLPLDGPDPECVNGHGEAALLAARRRRCRACPTVGPGHSKPGRGPHPCPRLGPQARRRRLRLT